MRVKSSNDFGASMRQPGVMVEMLRILVYVSAVKNFLGEGKRRLALSGITGGIQERMKLGSKLTGTDKLRYNW